jgi:GH25 family lysozyme M1 (1,4-beta-N-acetylmuramidase)
MSMKGIDISNWQAGIVPSNMGVDFCICKATEGVGFTDAQFREFVENCKANGLLFGFYHFARENDAAREAEYFYNVVKDYIGQGIPVLDYETKNSSNKAWCEKFITRFHELSGVWCVLYISASRCSQYKGSWIAEKCGLWVAGYPTPATGWTNAEMPYNIAPWSFAAIWQFTSSLKLSGWGGSLDGNIAYMDASAWKKYAGASGGSSGSTGKSVDELAREVINGKWGNGNARKSALQKAGYDYDAVQKRVNELLAPKSVEELAQEVIAGKWGNGTTRKNALEGAGYDYDAVQARVNELVGNGKSLDAIAKEVIRGDWGNGNARKSALQKAGYDYDAVQKRVNEMMG